MLKVWLPLDGDLRNLGCSNINVTGGIINNNGKIGKCYSVDSSSMIIITHNLPTTSEFSISFWMKVPTAASKNTSWESILSYSAINNANNNPSSIYISWTNYQKLKIYGTSNQQWLLASPTSHFSYDTWHHWTITHTANGAGVKCCIYIDGKLINTYNNTEHPVKIIPGTIYLGSGITVDKFYFNDFRIYDHCLSAAEVHEIAMGLVLHYKLNQNFGLTDIIKNQDTYNVYNNYSGSGTTGTLTNLSETYQGHVVRREVMTPNDTSVANFRSALGSHGVCGHRQTFLANTKYVFWIYYRPVSHTDVRVGGTASNISGWTEIPPQSVGGGWYRVGQYRDGSVTSNKIDSIFTSFRTPSAESGVPITIDWAAPHLLQGTTEIPAYDFFMENEVIDSSGYGHSGETVNEITISSDTPRYDSSTQFNGSNAAIKVSDNKWMAQGAEAITINLWAKSSAWTGAHLFSCTESGGFNTEAGTSGYLRFPVHVYTNAEKTSTAYKYDSKEIEIASLSTTDWNMLTFVYDSTGTRTYINGELHHTYTNTSYGIHFNTGARLFLGCEASGASPSSPYFNGQISDFRIYCTPLLDTDIKLLYNIGMRVDNLGGVHAFEFEETSSSKNKLTKTGILNNNIIEPYLTLSDGSNWKLMLYHYVDNGNNLFTSSNATYCNDFGLYSRLRDINNYTYNGKYEFYVIQDDEEFRWTQTSQPTASSIAGLTTVEGYNNPVNGLAKANQSNTYIGYNAWWGACGCWTKYSTGGKTGIPGFGSHNGDGICEKYLALYARIEKNNASFENSSSNSTEFIEI